MNEIYLSFMILFKAFTKNAKQQEKKGKIVMKSKA